MYFLQSTEFSRQELFALQSKIEDFTMKFDDTSVFKRSQNLIKQLIRKELPSAKEYLKNCLSTEDFPLLHQFGHYTLEAIMIHVLGLVFNSVREYPVVRASTLVKELESAVRAQALIIMDVRMLWIMFMWSLVRLTLM